MMNEEKKEQEENISKDRKPFQFDEELKKAAEIVKKDLELEEKDEAARK